MICFGPTKLPSLFPTSGGFPLWVEPLLEVVPLVVLYVSMIGQIICAHFLGTYFGSIHFVVRRRPTFFGAVGFYALAILIIFPCLWEKFGTKT